MARHSSALKAVEQPTDAATVDDALQVDIEDPAVIRDIDAIISSNDAPPAPTAQLTPTPAKRGRKPRADAGRGRKVASVVDAPPPPKLVTAPEALDAPPVRMMFVPGSLSHIKPGAHGLIRGATVDEVFAAADHLGIREHVWVQTHADGAYVWHDPHPDADAG